MIRHTYEMLESIVEEIDNIVSDIDPLLDTFIDVDLNFSGIAVNLELLIKSLKAHNSWLINLEKHLQKVKPELLDELYAISDTF